MIKSPDGCAGAVPLRPGPKPRNEELEDELAGDHDQELEVGFQFVAETGTTRPKGAVRFLIRSRARRKRYSRNDNPPLHHVTHKFRHLAGPGTTDALISRNASRHIDHGPTTNLFDPFDVLPIDKHGNTHYIITQYNAMWYPEDNPYAPSYAYAKEDVLQFAMSDAASLHVFITHVAMSLSTQADPKLARDASYHYSRAIGEVNRRIESSKDEEIPNATVFAVGCLVHAEITSNSVDRLNMHVNGLEALVNTKGGIQALSADSFTYKFTRWIDNICAIAMGSKPRFGGNDTGPYPDPAGWKTSSDIGLRYKIRLSNLTGLDDLAEETIEIYHILRHLIAAIHHSHLRISKDDFEVYSEQLTRRLLNIVQNKALEPPNPNALIFRLFGYAALAHVTNFICTPARRGSVLELMSIRLRESLEITNIRSFQIAYPEMMLWIIMVGGLAANGTPNHEWFAALLSESCLAAGVNKITELGLLLSEFLWSESYLHPVCKNFWDDVATAQAMGVSRESGSGSGIG